MREDCGILIKKINDGLERDANNDLRESGLTVSQAGILSVLSSSGEDGMPLKKLEERLHIAQPTAAGIIRRMVQSGLLEYYADPSDGRAKNVRMTERGKELSRWGREQMEKAERKLLDPLTEEEAAAFRSCLEKISRSFK